MAQPLASLKVLDFSTLLPGPYASMLLADMGAEVLRVESPSRVDLVRVMPPHVKTEDGDKVSAAHAFLNRGKQSIALDLKQAEAVDIILRLVSEYDIVIEQFRPGVMDRLGIGYESLKKVNPRLIYCAITGYGQTGPYAHRAGHDINYLSLSGVMSYSGRESTGPSSMGIQVADIAGGSHHAVMGVLAAVIHRQQIGEGQYIDISMTDAAFALNAMSGAGFLASGTAPKPEGEMLNGASFYDFYQTSDGRSISVGGLEPQFIQQLFNLLGRPELASRALSQTAADQALVKGFLKETFASQSLAHWQTFFNPLDLCVEPVLRLDESATHPQMVAREMVISVSGASSELRQPGHPVKFSGTPCQAGKMGGAVGSHTENVLHALGYEKQDIAALKSRGVIK
ncbi:MAG: CoA transferase [Hahellaceae bacterium]|nr:CoA transferase [Hahellaceae bacterium]